MRRGHRRLQAKQSLRYERPTKMHYLNSMRYITMRLCDVYHRLGSHPTFDDDTERRTRWSARPTVSSPSPNRESLLLQMGYVEPFDTRAVHLTGSSLRDERAARGG